MYNLGGKVQEGKGSTDFIRLSKRNMIPLPKMKIYVIFNEAHPYIIQYSRLTT